LSALTLQVTLVSALPAQAALGVLRIRRTTL
jgi:hypothetical protein